MRPSLRRCLLPLLSVLFVVALGCSSSRPQVRAPEYERGATRGASIAILPLSSELVSSDAGAELDAQAAYFTGEGRKLFYRLFALELREAAAAEVVDLGSDFRPESVTFRRQALPVAEGDSLRIPIPTGPVALGDRDADFLLLIDNLTFTPRTETQRAGDYGAPGTREASFIIASCQYLLWDNREHRVAAYGTFGGENRFVDPQSRTPYEQLFAKLAVYVIDASPIALDPRLQATAVAP